MSFQRLLIHRCDLIFINDTEKRDSYGRPIPSESNEVEAACRAEYIKQHPSHDSYAEDYTEELVLFLLPDQLVSQRMMVKNIRDQLGHSLVPGVFQVEKITPCMSRLGIHHYEITLKRVGE